MRNLVNKNGKNIRRMDTIYIGYDPREHVAVEKLIASIQKLASAPINIVTINQLGLRRSGLYYRTPHNNSTVWAEEPTKDMYDAFDNKPYSTEFSFSRFLVPFLNQYEGFALFMDCDMYFRSDPCEIFEKYATNDAPAIQCVQHDYAEGGKITTKLYGCPQTFYTRKNWSSLMLWNCAHKAHENLTVSDVNTKPGAWLHNFKWIEERDIGAIPEEWNWLDGHSDSAIEPKVVHFTTGGPWFSNWVPGRDIDKKYSSEWLSLPNEFSKI